MKNREFKVGDRVKYTSEKYKDAMNNPLWGGRHGKIKGTIDHLPKAGLPIYVIWDNGAHNTYKKMDLELINKQEQLNLFEG